MIDLMRSAPQRYETVRAALRYRGDGSVIKAVRNKYLESEVGRLETGGLSNSKQKDRRPEPEGPISWRCHIWYAGVSPGGGGLYRVELELPKELCNGDGLHIYAWDGVDNMVDWRTDGSRADDDPDWLRMAHDSFWTTYLFDPDGIAGLPLFLDALDLEVADITCKAHREAVRLLGVPVEEWEYDPQPLSWGADEYEILVDTERGVLLRCSSRLDGKDFETLEVEEIHFDEQFTKDIFTIPERLPWR